MNTYYPIIYNPNANQLQELPQYSELNLAENSVSIGTFFDSNRDTGFIGQYLSVDVGGVVWTSVPPTASSDGISIFKDGSIVGAAFSFNQLNFIGELVGVVSSTSPFNTANITIDSYWRRNSAGINTLGRVGIGSTLPTVELDIIGNAKITGVLTATTFVGTATTSTNIDISATTSTDTTTSVVLVANQATGGQSPFIDSGLTYNANTNNLIASLFSGDVSSTNGTIANLSGTIGTVTTLNSTNGTITNLSGTIGTVTTLNSTNGTITTLGGTTGTITNLSSTNLSGTIGTVTTLNSTNGTITNLSGTIGTVTTLNSTNGTITTLNGTTGTITNLSSTNLSGTIGTVTTLNSTNGTITTLNGTTGTITNLSSTNLSGTIGTVTTFNNTKANLTNVNVSGITTFTNTTDNTLGNPNTGAVQIDGGLGVNRNVSIDGNLDVDGVADLDGANITGVTTVGSITASNLGVSGVSTFGNNVRVENNLYVGGTSEFIGVATFRGGTINLGDSNSDDINVGGEFTSNLVPNVDNTYDLGTGTKRWRNINASGIITSTNLNVSGVATIGSAVTISTGNINAAGIVTATSFVGSGVNLTGIVTQIAAGIGINFFSSQSDGKGKVTIDSYFPRGKTIFVSQNGNDANTGLTEDDAKKTIKAAAAIAFPGDTIKVYPGVYVENNPIVLSRTVSVEGTELRNCVVTPRYLNRDLFHVNNGCHITDLSFIGDAMTDGASIVALQPLLGVATDRFFDAARMIRLNLDYIAQEAVGFLTSGFSGYAGSHRDQDAARLIDLNRDFIAAEAIGFLTSTDYKNPAFTVVNASGISTDPVNCEDDIKSILDAISYDLKAGSNKKSIGAGLSYYDDGGTLLHITGISSGTDGLQSYSVKEATIAAINYAVGIATNVINNIDYGALAGVTTYSSLTQDFSYSPILVSGGCTDVVARIENRSGIITNILGDFNYTAGITTVYGVTLESQDCADDVKDIWQCVIHDVTRGGNSRCVAAGRSYFDANWNLIPQILKNPGEVEQTITTLDYSFNIARSIINNSTWGGYPVGVGTTVVNAEYDGVSGIVTITSTDHGLSINDAVKIVGLAFTCPSPSGVTTSIFPDGTYGNIFNVKSVVGVNTFEVVVGTSTITHAYDSGGAVQKYTNFQHEFTQVKDLSMQVDPDTGFNNAINGCANVVSALRSCIGVVTSIVGFGSTSGIATSYPGNRGYGFSSNRSITTAAYNNVTGITTLSLSSGYSLKTGDIVELRDLVFSCDSGAGIGTTTQKFPSGRYGYEFYVSRVNDDGTVSINVGVSTLEHTYVSGGFMIDRSIGVTTAAYDGVTGITTIKAPGTILRVGDVATLRDLEFSCSSGAATTTIYPTGNNGYDFKVLSVVGNTFHTATNADYDPVSGITTITVPSHGFSAGDKVIVKDRSLIFTCSSDGNTQEFAYPRYKDPISNQILPISNVTANTFEINAGASPVGQQFAHTFVKSRVNGIENVVGQFTVNTGVSTIAHDYVSGGYVLPAYSKGVGPIVQGPYIRNCTNFVPGSIGMKIDGFDAEPGESEDIGVTGTMSVDSYTQYNQGGIGVSITNGAYAQLVSIFTICDDIAIFTGGGGQCDITNSNSSFGRLGLVSKGVGDPESKSIYRSTGIAVTDVTQGNNVVVVSGVGTYRPYDGQVCYFGDLYYFVDTISVTNGGSGYTSAPKVTITTPEGPNGITAQASSTIDAFGRVTAINLVNSGTQYSAAPTITIDPPPGVGVTATASVTGIQPIYYKVDSATLPISGISTVSFLQTLNNTVSAGTTVYFNRVSLQITSSHSFEWVGSGNDINTAKPALGGVVIPENEVVQEDGGIVVYTSTDQAGNFKIGDGVVINQATGQISGRDFTKALFTTMTPFILALSD